MKVTLGVRPDIKCPDCGTIPSIETGFWGGLLVSAFLNRFEEEGGTVTCPNCKTRYEVKGKKSC